jgi:CheY-like chemotaxis protein/anti-sigma regulatory factor (Ser/Thr protein kinase)
VEAVAPEAAAKDIAVTVHADEDAGLLRADPGRLQQVVWNLLSNAIKFTPKGGRVEASVRRADGRVELSVADTGKGILPETLPHIFDRFRQADSSTTRQYGGLGLGLSIVREIVELHGGSVSARSEGENAGATFTVTLPPCSEADAAEAAPAAPASGGANRLESIRILVVDDDADARALLRDVLQDAGAGVTCAASAKEAAAALEQDAPDILISDIGMPGEDGYALIQKVRALSPERGGAVPAVALTAFARPEDRRRALEAGFQRHVVKPVEPAALVALVAEILGMT